MLPVGVQTPVAGLNNSAVASGGAPVIAKTPSGLSFE
jgi:hypothetical protein